MTDESSVTLTDSLEEDAIELSNKNMAQDTQQTAFGEINQILSDHMSIDDEPHCNASPASIYSSPRNLMCFGSTRIPPLRLSSCTSSVITDTDDPHKGLIDIDLRSQSKEDCSPHEDAINGETEQNAALHQFDIQKEKVIRWANESSPTKASKCHPLSKHTIASSPHGGNIYVGDVLLGRSLRSETKFTDATNFIRANKLNILGRKKKPMGSYSMKHQKENTNNIRNPTLPSLCYGGETDRLLDQRERMAKAALSTPLLSYMAHGINEPMERTNEHFGPNTILHDTEECSLNPSLFFQTLPNATSEKDTMTSGAGKRDKSDVVRYNSMDHIGSPVSDVRVHPLSASGVYRKVLQEQAELIRAHKQFYEDRNSSRSLTRLDTLCQLCSTSNAVSQGRPPSFPVCQQMRKFDSVDTYLQKYKGTTYMNRSHHPAIRPYTLKDFSLLPKIPAKSNSLGPDFESEEYKAKLNKYKRLHEYAELVRYRWANQQQNRQENYKKPELKNEYRRKAMEMSYPLSQKQTPQSESLECLQAASMTPAGSSENERSPHYLPESSRNEISGMKTSAKISERELEKQKAIEKREAMKHYSENIRRKLATQRRKEKLQPNPNKPLASNQFCFAIQQASGSSSAAFNPDNDAHLTDLIKRHEDDKRRADALRRAIRVAL